MTGEQGLRRPALDDSAKKLPRSPGPATRRGQNPARASGRVTRDDVARHAGVSNAVVSYTLNGGPKRVAPATRERVMNAVRVLHYRPNAAARALNRGSMEMLGLLVPDSRNPYFAELCHTTEAAAAEHGQALLIINVEGGSEDASHHMYSLASRQVAGLIIASQLSPRGIVTAETNEIRTVLLNQFGPVHGLSTIGVSLADGARLGVEHLIGHGHTDIAFIGGSDPADGREQGWMRALTDAGLRPGAAVRGEFSPAGGLRAGEELLGSRRVPTAVFVSADYQAIGALRAFQEAGLQVPQDVALVSFDGTAGAEYSWPAMTTVAPPVREMVAEALRQLLEPGAWSAGWREYPTSLVRRRSCGCPHSDTPEAGAPS